ncbi:hypothetical protein GCM10007301_30830 [Azorhizobium oxalatiphilum]|uniref:Uncharacterized protein n=1 Tax=Azorhizobium oxalatiphilum TaxID=980631 RepID=A0A917FDJ9_9HYPH|nr:hypothetical protein GCM10007301_30830 [Azorhizobium oxalatiphilum]
MAAREGIRDAQMRDIGGACGAEAGAGDEKGGGETRWRFKHGIPPGEISSLVARKRRPSVGPWAFPVPGCGPDNFCCRLWLRGEAAVTLENNVQTIITCEAGALGLPGATSRMAFSPVDRDVHDPASQYAAALERPSFAQALFIFEDKFVSPRE